MRWTRLIASLAGLSAAASAAPLWAQQTGRITGTVSESQSGAPVVGTSITVVGTRLGAVSGADGKYTIAGVPPGLAHLRAARIGYQPKIDSVTVAGGETATQNFQLTSISVTLNSVVVVGYGTQKRSDLTGAVASVTPNVERTPTTSLEQALQGTVPGVQVTAASNAPGGGISIRIRGGSSVSGNNEPLYVVDGFPIENDPNNSSPTSGGRDATVTVPANPLAALNPNDIASIEILKDASATSIYGARGANGVVIITTKQGSGAKPRVTLDAYTGVQNIAKRYDLLNAREFADFANTWAQQQSTPTTPFPDPASVPNTDWQDLVFRSAPMSSLQMGVTGGSQGANTTRYALSGGVLQQQGIVVGSDFKRISLRGNLDQTAGQRIRVLSNVNVSRVSSNMVPTDGSFNAGAGAVGAAIQYIPIMPARRADGSYTLASTDYPTVLSALGLTGGNIPNPLATANEVQDNLGDTRVLANASGELTLLKGLVFRTNIGADLSDRTRDTYYPRTTLQGAGLNGRAIRGDLKNTSWLNEYTLNFQRSGGIHSLQALAGYTRQALNTVRTTADNTNFVSDITGFENIGAGSQTGGPTVGSGRSGWTLASYLGRVNYTLSDRYLFTVTGREDGSSRFGPDNRWGFFPSAAAGWRISEEPFMRRFGAIDQLKLRVSYGLAGNPSIQPYQSMTRLSPQQYTFGGQLAPGYYPSSLGNDKLSWESTKQTDVGLDFGLFQGRLDLTADYYDKRTDDLLLQIDLPPESGFSSAFVNAGSISNKGFELGLTLRVIRGDEKKGAFSWSTTFSFAKNRNRVLDLGGVQRLFATSTNSDIKAAGSMVQVGQPIGVFFGYKTNGIFRDSLTLATWLAKTKMGSGSTPGLGTTNFVDVDGNGIVNADDRTIIGDPNPDFTGGWQNSFSWKGFQLLTLVDGSSGNQIFNLNLNRLEGAAPSGNVLRERVADAWSPTNPNGKFAKIGAGTGFLGSDFTDELVEDGSFMRLRNVSLSRDLPSSMWGRAVSARAFVSGQNLLTLTHYSGFNPDVSSLGVANMNRGIDIGAYPLSRTFTFGINFSY
jgi:TonB-linked SusC/RagA family outer membrane protein